MSFPEIGLVHAETRHMGFILKDPSKSYDFLTKIFQSQQDVKRALQSIPISDTRFYFRLQRAFERVIRFETSEYHIALIESSYQYST